MRAFFFSLTVLLTFFRGTTVCQSTVKLRSDKKSKVECAMHHPMHDWSFTSSSVASVMIYDKRKEIPTVVAISIPLASFDSKNANRDSHMIEATEGLKYPNVTFKSDSIISSRDSLIVVGLLTFHGIKKSIKVSLKQVRQDKKLIFTGAFGLDMRDHQIDPPSLMGIPTDPEMLIRLCISFPL